MYAPGQVVGAAQHHHGGEYVHVPGWRDILASQPRVEIKEKVNWIQEISGFIGAEIEMGNKYNILAADGVSQIMYAVETTGFCARQLQNCCPDCAPFRNEVLVSYAGGWQPAFQADREWSCTCCCFNRPVMKVNDKANGAAFGTITDPCTCCNYYFSLRDPSEKEVLNAQASWCQLGLICPLPCGPCAEVNFTVNDSATGSQVGSIQKKVPGCCKFFFAPDVDNYKIEFGGVAQPDWKAMIIALTLYMDYRFFNDNKNDDNGGVAGVL